jgi:hypothetical protein
MKKIIICFFVIGIAIIVGIFGGKYLKNKKEASDQVTQTAISSENDILWGISVNAYPTGPHIPETLERVTNQINDLGVSTIRYTFPSWSKPDPFEFTDTVMARWKDEPFKIVMAFQPNIDYIDMEDPYQQGYDQANKLAKRYPQVSYFQMGNEPGNHALKPNWNGATKDSYENTKYVAVAAWLKGASNAIAANNKSAKKMITGNWLGAAFFEKLVEDGIQFEIIGWDWFGETANNITTTKADEDNIPILDRLAKLKKDIWLTECGITGKDEKQQATYLSNFIKETSKKDYVKAIFVGVFFDQAHLVDTDGQYDGIYSIVSSGTDKFTFGKPKQAYQIFKQIISNNK